MGDAHTIKMIFKKILRLDIQIIPTLNGSAASESRALKSNDNMRFTARWGRSIKG